jgi:hypothetical protein
MTDTDISDISDEELEGMRATAGRVFHYCDAELTRRKQKPITPEERAKSLEQCRNIAKNLEKEVA